jgi:WD40 repeat protein
VQATVTALAFSPSRPEAALGFEEGTVALYDLGTGTLLRRFEGHIANVTSVVFSRDGRQLLSSSKDRTIRLWDVVTARQRGQIEGQSEFEGAVFCSDGHQVLSAGGKVVIVWDLQTGKERKRFEGHTAGLWSVALSSDGRRALSGGSDGAWLWDMETGEGVWLFGPTVIAAMSVAFSPDGRRILIGTDEIDRSLLLFDVETGKELHRFVGHGQAVRSVIFLPDGRHALTGSWDKTLRLWRLPPPGKQE